MIEQEQHNYNDDNHNERRLMWCGNLRHGYPPVLDVGTNGCLMSRLVIGLLLRIPWYASSTSIMTMIAFPTFGENPATITIAITNPTSMPTAITIS